MFAAQQGVQKTHDALSQRANECTGLLISYFNASSKAYEGQRDFPLVEPILVAKLRRVRNELRTTFGTTLMILKAVSRLVANQFTRGMNEL